MPLSCLRSWFCFTAAKDPYLNCWDTFRPRIRQRRDLELTAASERHFHCARDHEQLIQRALGVTHAAADRHDWTGGRLVVVGVELRRPGASVWISSGIPLGEPSKKIETCR